ncbi:unnamed protein product [Bursaphelenchus xylophilus]|uniref:(pine wood nematode) hypothetical protein n=1 Tax=Bursaphelenchus xylophilus TaxID=6326 RepID=A0A1I7S094_BURXY|nr:unnamed protein product [Bursaphelenchus xylophilus]CAG9108940.1 unnamed protein product [Bursaphelenchus xylophilus]
MPPTDVCLDAETSSTSSFESPVSFQSENDEPCGIRSQEDFLRLKMIHKVKNQEYQDYVCTLWLQNAQAEQEKSMEAMRRYFENKQKTLHR